MTIGSFRITSTIQFVLNARLTDGVFARAGDFSLATSEACSSDSTSFWMWGALVCDEAQLLGGLYLQLRLLLLAPFYDVFHDCSLMPEQRKVQ